MKQDRDVAGQHSRTERPRDDVHCGLCATFVDNRKSAAVQRQLQSDINFSPRMLVQRQENRTGMPDQLKTGLEQLSGMNMGHVRVHYNSSKPAQLNAHAFTQGSNIHVAPGQEKHLPHEGWHVVQQAQGRVKPTKQLAGTQINDNAGLEQEADVMGARAAQRVSKSAPTASKFSTPQRQTDAVPSQMKRVSDGASLGSINSAKYPESVGHIKDAIGGGHADRVTVMRSGARRNRRQSLKGIPTKKGSDRDEYPMAMFSEGGGGASVRYIDPSDNRGAGSTIGHMLSGEPDGTQVDVEVVAEKDGTTTIQL